MAREVYPQFAGQHFSLSALVKSWFKFVTSAERK